MQSKDSIYSYIINVLTLAKISKVELTLKKKSETLDKIIALSLSELDKFEELDTLNPHQNLSLKVKCIVINEKGEFLLKVNKKSEEILSFTPSLSFSLKDDLKRRLNSIFDNEVNLDYKIVDLINLADLKEEKIVKKELSNPIYLLLMKVYINSSKINKKGFIFNNDISKVNKIDKFILSKGE